MLDSLSLPNVIQLDRPAHASELRGETSPTPPKSAFSSVHSTPPSSNQQDRISDPTVFHRRPNFRPSTKSPPTAASSSGNSGVYIAASDRKIMRANEPVNKHHLTSRPLSASRQSSTLVTLSPDISDNNFNKHVDVDHQDNQQRVTRTTVTFKSSAVTIKPASGKPLAFYSSNEAISSRPSTTLLLSINFLIFVFPIITASRWLNRL